MFDGIIQKILSDLIKSGLIALAAYLNANGFVFDASHFVADGLAAFSVGFMWYENHKDQIVAQAAKLGTQSVTVSQAVKKVGLAAIALLFLLPLAERANAQMPTKAPPAAATPVCATAFCTGWYVGAGFDGNGTNADIIGGGLTNSVFGAGAIPNVQGGFQYWNGSVFIDGETGGGYLVPSKGVAAQSGGFIGYQEMQVGGKLSGLLGNSQPIAIPSALSADLISLYVALGVAEMKGATGLESGAGAKFVLGPNALLDLGYRYIPFNNGINDNLVRVRFSYIFK